MPKLLFPGKSLQDINPALAAEWHPTKNDKLTPRDVTPFSDKNVWWQCNKGHEWITRIAHRSHGSGCPYCSGRRATEQNCLATINPSLAAEWHPTKNGNLTPRTVTPSSNAVVWWQCGKGHEWKASVNHRSKGTGCPYCTGRAASKENCLATINPSLAAEWHPTKNGNLTPGDITSSSNKKVWWICRRNHEWDAVVCSRSQGSGCPFCHSQISQLELAAYCEIKYLFSDVELRKKVCGRECDIFVPKYRLAIEIDGVHWHRDKYQQDKEKSVVLANNGITLLRIREGILKRVSDSDIFFSSKEAPLDVIHKIINKLRSILYLDEATLKRLDEYLKGKTLAAEDGYRQLLYMLPSPLPEFSLQEQNPILASEWHPNKNGSLTPLDVTLRSGRKVWWICSKGHEWVATISGRSTERGNRNQGTGCPYCSGRRATEQNCLATINPSLAAEWHPTKNGNLTPKDVMPFSGKKVWWICSKNHAWQAAVYSRSDDSGCPFCSRRTTGTENCLATTNPALALEWHPTKNGSLTPMNVASWSRNKVWWLCNKGHEWEASVGNRNQGTGCPYCSGKAAGADNCLATINPELAQEWHPTKNGSLTPTNITSGSSKKVWWQCKNGHEWEAVISHRSNGIGCPYCSGRYATPNNCLKLVNHGLAEEWHPTKNGNLTPMDVLPMSDKIVWWQCKNGHEWEARIKNRSNGIGCPYCSGKKQ